MDKVLHFLYDLPPLHRPRTKPMEVLAVGMPRSATESLAKALLQLGYDHTWHGMDSIDHPSEFQVLYRLGRRKWDGASHGECHITAAEFDELFGHSVAVTDAQATAFAYELIEAYPNAKVILNYRSDEDAWFKSIEKTMGRGFDFWTSLFATLFCGEAFWARRGLSGYIWTGLFRGSVRKNARWVRREHHAMIRGMVPPDRLLEWCVEDGWVPLCKFLDKPVPNDEFPRGNAVPELLAKAVILRDRWKRVIIRNMSITAAAMVSLGAIISRCCM